MVSDDRKSHTHCVMVAKKAQGICGLILRHLSSRNIEIYKKAFVSLVRPIVEYASSVWSPYSIHDVNLIESVQRTYTRRVFRKCKLPPVNYENRLRKLELDTLEVRRVKADLVLTYKIVKGLIDLPEGEYYRRSARSTIRSCKFTSTTQPRDEPSKHCFSYRTAPIWNAIPLNIIQSPSL